VAEGAKRLSLTHEHRRSSTADLACSSGCDTLRTLRTAVFSIISPNYRHFARVLMASLRRHHPEWERFVLIVGDVTREDDAFTSVPLSALALPNPRQFAFRYTLLELNTAVKPWMFEHLFARGFDRVLYFDPDIQLFSALEELEEPSFLTVTPHLTGSITGDQHPSERSILQAGTYNLGFLSVTRHDALPRFLSWWQEKLEYDCVVDIANGLFVDQKWIDLVPGLFPDVRVLRHEGYNVAYWNLEQRTVTVDGDRILVNGQPLRFFHFSGCDPAFPHVVSTHSPRPIADAGDAATLIARYIEAVRDAGYREFRSAPYSFATFRNGSMIPKGARIAYRNSPELQAAAGDDPFAHPELFHRFRETAPLLSSTFKARSYQILSRARPLVRLFPKSVRTAARERLLGRRESTPQAQPRTASLAGGLNIAGYFTRDTGVGESARRCAASCDDATIVHHDIDLDGSDALVPAIERRATILHVNADQIPLVRTQLPQLFDARARTIGCWHWELPELPDVYVPSAEPFDELWAPSLFIQSALASKLTIPVVHMPHGIEVTEVEPCTPQELGVPPDHFTFLCMFDFDSIAQRKNPMGAIDAFQRAFPDPSRTALLIKTTGAERHRDAYEALRGRPGVHLIDQTLSRARTNGLVAACDAVVSLHRSEGFGLVLAEAMYFGKPVIATGWSGNMDFMNSGNSCPVAFDLVTLDRAHGPYAAGQQWAEPDVGDAARHMRRIVEDDAHRAQIGARAMHTIRTHFSPAAAGTRYRKRLELMGLM
jgi:glycosyltransferase involved in cell wall biosynthesis